MALCVALLASSTAAAAEEQPLQAANGAALYLASLEGLLLVETPFIALTAGDTDLGGALVCTVLFPLCAVVAPSLARNAGPLFGVVLLGAASVLAVPPTIAGVGGAEGWDVNGSFVLTSAVHGALGGALVGGPIDIAVGGEGVAGALVGGVLIGGGAATYGALRHAEVSHDPRAGDEANALIWTPPLTMLATALLAAAFDLDGEVMAALAGMFGLTAQAITIGLTELALGTPPPAPPDPMMLVVEAP